jgi:hypothetical protein
MAWDRAEEARVDRAIGLVARHFAGDERAAVLAHLVRLMYRRPWRFVAAKAGVDEGRAEALARRGRRLLDTAIAAGRLREPALALALGLADDGCAPERRVDPRGPIRASRGHWRRPHSP